MMRDFDCDTSDCIHWDEEDGCMKSTSVKIQEHCCVDYEAIPVPELVIAMSEGMLKSIYTTMSATEVKVTVVDLDELESGDIAGSLTETNRLIKRAMREMNTIY